MLIILIHTFFYILRYSLFRQDQNNLFAQIYSIQKDDAELLFLSLEPICQSLST
jgi:hypothetical protein